MDKAVEEDVFDIQIRLFRRFQVDNGLSAADAEGVFTKYDVFDYIATCYGEYHVQGDEANLADIYRYLKYRGWRT